MTCRDMARERVVGSAVAAIAVLAIVVGALLLSGGAEVPGSPTPVGSPLATAAVAPEPDSSPRPIPTHAFEATTRPAEPVQTPPTPAPVSKPKPRAYLSGTVRSAAGVPIPKAAVHIMLARDQGGVRRWGTWCREVRTAIDGTFRFSRDPIDPRYEYAVFAESPMWHQLDVVRFRPGDKDVEIRLEPGSSLSGRIAGWPEAAPTRQHFDQPLVVAVRGLPGVVRRHCRVDGPREPMTHVAQLRPDGSFTVGGLPPGSATVSLELARAAPPLITVEDVPVPQGRVVVDPRLQPMDVRGRVHWATITARDPSGAPRSGVAVQVLSKDGSRAVWTGGTGEDGRWAFPIGEPVSLSVGAHGTRWAHLDRVDGDRVVTLADALEVELRLVDALAPSTGPPWLHARIQYLGPSAAPRRDTGFWLGQKYFDGGSSLSFRAPGPGRYRVNLVLEPVREKFG